MSNKTTKDMALYGLRNGFISSMRVTDYTIELLQAVVDAAKEDLRQAKAQGQQDERVMAGKFFITPLREESRAKFSNPDTAPTHFFRYLSRVECEGYKGAKQEAPAPAENSI